MALKHKKSSSNHKGVEAKTKTLTIPKGSYELIQSKGKIIQWQKRKRTKIQTMVKKTLHRKLKFELHSALMSMTRFYVTTESR